MREYLTLHRSVFPSYLTIESGRILSTHVHTYFFMISRTKFTKNVLVGSRAVLIRDEIHCNEYPGTRRVMSVGYPGRKFSTSFNPRCIISTSDSSKIPKDLHDCLESVMLLL